MQKQATTSRHLGTMAAATMLALAAMTFSAPVFAQSPDAAAPPMPDCSGTTVGATVLSLQYPFLVTLSESMAAEARRLGIDLVSLDPGHESDAERTQITELITQQVDAIIMIPVDGTDSQSAATTVNVAGIPLIEVHTKLDQSFSDDGGTIATHVGSDRQAGTIQGLHIINRGNPVKLIYLVDQDGRANTDLRREGFTGVLGQHLGLIVASELDGHGSRAEGRTLMEDLLETYGTGSIDGVVSQDDEMVLGALSAIEAAGRRDEFKNLIGIGAGPDAVQSIKDGGLTATVFQDAVGQGVGAVRAACRIIAGEDVPEVVDVPFALVTADNVDQYMP